MSYIHFNRMGGENLLSFNGPHVVGLNINQTINQPLCVGNANPTTCFRTTQEGYPEGYTTPASFNPLNVRVNYIPKRHADRQRARAGTSRCSARSSATCWSTSATSATRAATS